MFRHTGEIDEAGETADREGAAAEAEAVNTIALAVTFGEVTVGVANAFRSAGTGRAFENMRFHGAGRANAGQINHFAFDAREKNFRFYRRDRAVVKVGGERVIRKRFPCAHDVGRRCFLFCRDRVAVLLSGLVPSAVDADDPGLCHGALRASFVNYRTARILPQQGLSGN